MCDIDHPEHILRDLDLSGRKQPWPEGAMRALFPYARAEVAPGQWLSMWGPEEGFPRLTESEIRSISWKETGVGC